MFLLPAHTQQRISNHHLLVRVCVRYILVRSSPLRWSRLVLLNLVHDGERRHQHHLLVRVAGLLSFLWAGVGHCRK